MAVDETFTKDEMNIICTGLALLANNQGKGGLTKKKENPYEPHKTRFRILCTDGKRRNLSMREFEELPVKVARLSGHEVDPQVLEMLKREVRGMR